MKTLLDHILNHIVYLSDNTNKKKYKNYSYFYTKIGQNLIKSSSGKTGASLCSRQLVLTNFNQ